MSGRVTKDRDVRLKASNPAWLDRDREARGQGPAKVEAKIRRYRAGQTPHYAGDDADADDESEEHCRFCHDWSADYRSRFLQHGRRAQSEPGADHLYGKRRAERGTEAATPGARASRRQARA